MGLLIEYAPEGFFSAQASPTAFTSCMIVLVLHFSQSSYLSFHPFLVLFLISCFHPTCFPLTFFFSFIRIQTLFLPSSFLLVSFPPSLLLYYSCYLPTPPSFISCFILSFALPAFHLLHLISLSFIPSCLYLHPSSFFCFT